LLGADSPGEDDSCEGAASCAGAASWLGADSCAGADSCEGCDSCEACDSGTACGARVGGVTDSAEPEDPAPDEDLLDWLELPACFEVPVFEVLPGNALAATSANRPVSATLTAISQRFARCIRFRAASLVWGCSRISIRVVLGSDIAQWWWKSLAA
jgi:hypothetical protein